MLNDYYEQNAKAALTPVGMARQMTLREILGSRKNSLEEQLAAVNSAIEALDADPKITAALEAVQKVSRMM